MVEYGLLASQSSMIISDFFSQVSDVIYSNPYPSLTVIGIVGVVFYFVFWRS